MNRLYNLVGFIAEIWTKAGRSGTEVIVFDPYYVIGKKTIWTGSKRPESEEITRLDILPARSN